MSKTRPLSHRSNLGLLALEPRWMFDGAAAVDAAHAAPDASAKALIPTVPAPVEVRAADPAKDGGKKEVVFVDTSVAGYKALEAAVQPGIEIEEIDGGQSGLAQMAKWAETHAGYDSISVISHGAEAAVQIGTDTLIDPVLTNATVQAELAEIGHSLKAGGDLLLYGCDVARGDDGRQFVADLAAATGADVAASTDITGAADKGGNWTLEAATGIVTATSFDGHGWDKVLGWSAVGSGAITQDSVTFYGIGTGSDGKPWIAFLDTDTNSYRVMKFDGSQWNQLGSIVTVAQSGNATFINAPDGTIYYSYCSTVIGPYSQSAGPAIVEKWDGSSWVLLGSQASTGATNYISSAVAPSGTVYIAITDGDNSSDLTVRRFVNGSWETVGNAGFTAGVDSNIQTLSLAIAPDGTPYVAFEDSVSGKASVMKFDGTTWNLVGSKDFIGDNATFGWTATSLSLAISSNGTPYLACQGLAHSEVYTFDGTGWVNTNLPDIGSNGDRTSLIATSDGSIYFGAPASTGGDVLKLSGSTWSLVGTAEFGHVDSNYLTVGTQRAGAIAIASDGTVYYGFNQADSSNPFARNPYVYTYSSATGPTFTSGTVANFAENGTGTVYTAAATTSGGTVTYALSGADAGKFNIDATTGVLTFKTAPDYENPASAANSDVYSITIGATDNNGTHTRDVTVTVSDVAPAWTQAAVSVADTSVNGTAVATPTSTGDTSSIIWLIQNGNSDGLFAIDATSGAITIADATKFNFATTPAYTLTLRETDGTTNVDHDVTVNITHVTPGPTFTSGTSVTFAENGTGAVYTAAATTSGGSLSYGLGGADAGKFNIDATSGVLTFKAAPDYEAPASAANSNVYTVTISATDDNGTHTQNVAITVTNVAPAWTAPAPVSVNDDSANGAVVATLAGTGDTSSVTWSIRSGNTGGLFAINPATGAITIADASRFDVATTPSYTLTVRESDGTGNADHGVTVNVSHAAAVPVIVSPSKPPAPVVAPPAPVVVVPPPAPAPVAEPSVTIVRDNTPAQQTFTAPPSVASVADAPAAGDPARTTPVVVSAPVVSVVATAQFTAASVADGGFRVPVVTAASGGPAVEGLVALRPEIQVPQLLDGVLRVALPPDAFAHTRSDAVVVLSAARLNGQPLPSWLNFDSRSGTLTGTPPADLKGVTVVKIVARDDKGQEATITVRINGQPEKTGAIRDAKPQNLADARPGKIAFTQQLKLAARFAAIRYS